MDPIVLAKAHSGIAILVAIFYVIRGGFMLADSAKLNSILLSSINHTLVLILILMGLYTAHLKGIPYSNGFILSKFSCLALFVLLGGFSIKQGLSKPIAIILWLLGLATLVYAWMLGKHLMPAFF